MRRWLTIFLLILLPLQISWAVAAPYCEHETTPSRESHPGHHAHEHQDEAAQPAANEPADHPDCEACHLGAAGALFAEPTRFLSLALSRASPTPAAPLRTRGPDHPERPNWRRAR